MGQWAQSELRHDKWVTLFFFTSFCAYFCTEGLKENQSSKLPPTNSNARSMSSHHSVSAVSERCFESAKIMRSLNIWL